MLSIGITGPGDLHYGQQSLVRGEMRWWLNASLVLSKNKDYDITIIGQNNRCYTEDNIKYINVDVAIQQSKPFDILFSMDIFENCGLEENWMSSKVSKIKAKQRVFAPFFGSYDHQKSTIPVVYPFFYREVDNVKTFCLPTPFGTLSTLLADKNNFNQKNAIWFSKNSHENPEYLLKSLQYSLEAIKNYGGKLVIIDGHKLIENNNYTDAKEVKELLIKNKDFVWWNPKKEWLPYNKIKFALSKSKFITGIHHPVCSPMQVESIFYGAIPIIFENQKELPPFDNANIPYIKFDSIHKSFDTVYNNILCNISEYSNMLNECRKIATLYSDESFIGHFDHFLQVIK